MAKQKAAEKAAVQILTSVIPEEEKPRKTPFLENRTLAIILTVLAILAGTAFGAHRSVAAQARKLEQKFSVGVQYQGYSIQGDLSDRMEYASQLVKIAQRYNIASQTVTEAIRDLDGAGHGHACFAANRTLSDAVEALNRELVNTSLSTQDAQYRSEAYRNFVSAGDTISHEAALYNELVYEFNDKTLTAFPTGTLARLTGVRELEAFE